VHREVAPSVFARAEDAFHLFEGLYEEPNCSFDILGHGAQMPGDDGSLGVFPGI
jgi:hypothetical protein